MERWDVWNEDGRESVVNRKAEYQSATSKQAFLHNGHSAASGRGRNGGETVWVLKCG